MKLSIVKFLLSVQIVENNFTRQSIKQIGKKIIFVLQIVKMNTDIVRQQKFDIVKYAEKNLKHIKNLPKDFVQYNVKENGNQRKSEYLIQDSLVKKYNVNIVERNITKKNIKQTKINIIFVQKNVDKNGIQKYGHNVKSGKNIQETSC